MKFIINQSVPCSPKKSRSRCQSRSVQRTTCHHRFLKTENVRLQRARGTLNISAASAAGDKPRLTNLRQQGSYRAIFPRPIKGTIDAVIINTAGGITGGDSFSTKVTANNHAKISITTQAAERIYRATDEIAGSMQTRLEVKSNAQLHWLPQETILFEGSRLHRRLEVEVKGFKVSNG